PLLPTRYRSRWLAPRLTAVIGAPGVKVVLATAGLALGRGNSNHVPQEWAQMPPSTFWSHQALQTPPSLPTTKRSRCVDFRATAATFAPGTTENVGWMPCHWPCQELPLSS